MKKVKFWVRCLIEREDTAKRLGIEVGTRIKIEHEGYVISVPSRPNLDLAVAHTVDVTSYGAVVVRNSWAIHNVLTGAYYVKNAPTRKDAIERVVRLSEKPNFCPAESLIKGFALLHGATEWRPPV